MVMSEDKHYYRHLVVMTCGYVEDSLVSRFMITSERYFETHQEALESLAMYFYKFYKLRIYENSHYFMFREFQGGRVSACCYKNFNETYVCPVCNTKQNFIQFDSNEFKSFIKQVVTSTCDQCGIDDIGTEWSPYYPFSLMRQIPEEKTIDLDECAEAVLLMALPEDIVGDKKELLKHTYIPTGFYDLVGLEKEKW